MMSGNNSGIEDGLRLLFQRPNEPLFTVKDSGKTVFELPSNFYTERYKTIGSSLSKYRESTVVNVYIYFVCF